MVDRSKLSFYSGDAIDRIRYPVQIGDTYQVTITNDGDTTAINNDFGAPQQAKIVNDTVQYIPDGETVGSVATGSAKFQNSDTSYSVEFSKGTLLTSGGLIYKTNADVTVPGASFDGGGVSSPGEATVSASAVASGSAYNVSNQSATFDDSEVEFSNTNWDVLVTASGGTGATPNFEVPLIRGRWSIDGGADWQPLDSRIVYEYTIDGFGNGGLDSAITIGCDGKTIFFKTANGRHGNATSSASGFTYTPTSRTFTIQYWAYEG